MTICIYSANRLKTIKMPKEMERVKLSEAIRRSGADMAMPCGGLGICGKCRVWAKGRLSPPSPKEVSLLGESLKRGCRLACMAYAEGDCEIQIFEADSQILTQAGAAAAEWSPLGTNYGFAVDIGTTTVAVELWDLSKPGRRLAGDAFCNPQAAYGADVISRIQAAMEGLGGELRQRITERLNESMVGLLRSQGINPGAEGWAVITGNTAMLYLLTGTEPSPLSRAPFAITAFFGGPVSPERLSLPSLPGTRCYLPRTVSAFVGGDITCAILAADLCRGDGIRLLADIGTNGEMALYRDGVLWCCSTAAGPAFEGAGIAMGCAAADGALSRLDWRPEGGFSWSVIGRGENAPADGICGSGLIDAVAACLETGLVDETGRIDQERAESVGLSAQYEGMSALRLGESGVILTQTDLRAVQLAKSAICAGIRSLLHEAGVQAEEVTELVLAGGFGSYLRSESALRIGLIPSELAGKARSAGNAALSGALLMLQSGHARREGNRIAQEAVLLELSTSSYFMERYVEEMIFSPGGL